MFLRAKKEGFLTQLLTISDVADFLEVSERRVRPCFPKGVLLASRMIRTSGALLARWTSSRASVGLIFVAMPSGNFNRDNSRSSVSEVRACLGWLVCWDRLADEICRFCLPPHASKPTPAAGLRGGRGVFSLSLVCTCSEGSEMG